MKTLTIPLVLALSTPVWAQDALPEIPDPIPQETTKHVRYAVTGFGWSPYTQAKTDFSAVRGDSDLSTGTVNRQSMGAYMLQAEAHYGAWGIMANAVYAKSSMNASRDFTYKKTTTSSAPSSGSFGEPGAKAIGGTAPTTTTTTYEPGTIDYGDTSWTRSYTVAASYTAYASKDIYVDTILGARMLSTTSKVWGKANTQTQQAETTAYSTIKATAAVAGVKGRFRVLDTDFFIPVYLDAGAGGAITWTSQQTIGIGYTFEPVDVALVYSNVHYAIDKNNMSSSINMSGPAFSATVRF